MVGFGERLARVRDSHRIRCADPRAIYLGRAIDSQGSRNSMLATTRILVSELATARVFCYPPTTPNSLMAPSLSSRDLSAPTISSDKGSGTSPPPPTVDILKNFDGWNWFLEWFLVSYVSALIRFSFPLLVTISMYSFVFGKLAPDRIEKKKGKLLRLKAIQFINTQILS